VKIRDVARRWEEVWNSHDMAAMATLLAPDADFVNVSGRHWKGRQEIEREHAQRHQVHFKESVWTTHDVAIQSLAADLALVHVKWTIVPRPASVVRDVVARAVVRSGGLCHCPLAPTGQALLGRAAVRLGLSARTHDRVVKVARTIADLAEAEAIAVEHRAEALAYRTLDRRPG
jgi:uncharacterized protein (TIGR02246 family)